MTPEGQTVGELLRQGRLKQRLSIAECAKRTHIAVRYLEAIEEQRWADLPSESHRLGFLKLYSRFLGVSAEDVIKQYQQKFKPTPIVESPKGSHPSPDPHKERSTGSSPIRWSVGTIPQLIGGAILALLLSWGVYHAFMPHFLDQNPMPWTRRRTSPQSRLVVPKSTVATQKVSITSLKNCWLRITMRHELLFEGILPMKASKVWNLQGPYQIKIGNIHAISLFWNDQPVDITAGATGSINEIRIPPQP